MRCFSLCIIPLLCFLRKARATLSFLVNSHSPPTLVFNTRFVCWLAPFSYIVDSVLENSCWPTSRHYLPIHKNKISNFKRARKLSELPRQRARLIDNSWPCVVFRFPDNLNVECVSIRKI